jgi:SAM-dependent methyltransferase
VANQPPPDATHRFGNRADHYVRYRPSYPRAVLTSLHDEFGLRVGQVVADVGSGTGIFSVLLVAAGHVVYGVEPNPQMRTIAERLLGDQPTFHSVAGAAEATTLPVASVDWVVAAQAFHWFDVDAARHECRRILRPCDTLRANVALLWNDRREDTPFLRQYEAVLRACGTDYPASKHQNVETDGRLARFFAGGYERRSFANRQVFDFAGLCGRTLSSSYAPPEEDPRWPPLRERLQDLFERYADRGTVVFEYDTRVYVGTIP